MPSTSPKQQRLMVAAYSGAQFPAAKKIRESMSLAKIHEFMTLRRRPTRNTR